MRRDKVLSITKRTAEMCATKGILYAAGFDLMTATNLPTARAMLKALPIKGVIVCTDSWSEEERERITSDIRSAHPQAAVMMRCPGCQACDEERLPGTLLDMRVTRLISEMKKKAQ